MSKSLAELFNEGRRVVGLPPYSLEQGEAISEAVEALCAAVIDRDEAPSAPTPITCCGEWTWREQGWHKADGSHHLIPSHTYTGDTIHVCRKCHRALLEDGQMTGERGLVDADAMEAEEPAIYVTDEVKARLLKRTWGAARD